MEALQVLWESVLQLVLAVWELLVVLGMLILPWLPLAGWIAFWTLAVNWVRLRQALLSGGWIGWVLIGVVAILVWGVVAPPLDGTHYILGLTLSNFVGKTVYVTLLSCIALLCGAIQLSGCCGEWTRFEEQEGEPEVLVHH